MEIEFLKVEIVYHSAKPRQVVVALHHFRQFVVDEGSGQDGVEMTEHDGVQLGRKRPEEKVLRVQSLRQSLTFECVSKSNWLERD